MAIRCKHGLIREQCSICQKSDERHYKVKMHKAMNKVTSAEAKQTKN